MSLPTNSEIEALHKKYAPNQAVYDLVYTHCKVVNEIAQNGAKRAGEPIDLELLRAACLLHDIGTYVLFDDEGHVQNQRLYPQHAILGTKIVVDEGLDPRIAKIIETHILMGLSKAEITDPASRWVLPARDYIPDSIEGDLLCYGDRFHSKHPVFNSYDSFLERLARDMPIQAEKFKNSVERFGMPDIDALAKKYGHPVR